MKRSAQSIVMTVAHQLFAQKSGRTGKRFYATFGEALKAAWYFFKVQCGGKVGIYFMRELLEALGTPSREEYEAFCKEHGIAPLDEKTLATSYLRHGNFGFDQFDMLVHQRRAFVSVKEYKAPEASQATKDLLAAQDAFWAGVEENCQAYV